MDKHLFISNREGLYSLLPDKSVAVFSATVSDTGSLPVDFVQDANFYYLTGLKTANAQVVFHKNGKAKSSYLFIERNIPPMEVWIGKKLSKEETKSISGIEKVFYIDEFPRIFHGCVLASEVCFFDHVTNKIGSNLTDSLFQLKEITTHYPALRILHPGPFMTPLRSVKKEQEIENMQKAIDITGYAIRNLISHTTPGMTEYELEAHFRYECIRNNAKQMSFSPIIASGMNATILHYEKNCGPVEDKELIITDVGTKWNEYCADITRTFPSNGTFTDRQRQVYLAVLEINKAIITKVKQGVTLQDLQDETVMMIKKALKRLKLIKKEEDFKKYYMHSVSHHLGLEAHDLVDRSKKLEAGNVITVEPGIYIPEEKLGVRIEDDVLVTKNGCRNLSRDIPKEINDIEKLMK